MIIMLGCLRFDLRCLFHISQIDFQQNSIKGLKKCRKVLYGNLPLSLSLFLSPLSSLPRPSFSFLFLSLSLFWLEANGNDIEYDFLQKGAFIYYDP